MDIYNDKINMKVAKYFDVPYYIDNNLVQSEEDFMEEFRKRENRTWFLGDVIELERFYKYRIRGDLHIFDYNYYRVVIGNTPRIHYPIARLISQNMANLLFAEKPEIKVGDSDRIRTKKYNDILDKCFEENKIDEFLYNCAVLESYSGAVGIKIVLDNNISEYPILLAYPKERMKVKKKFGKVITVDFLDDYEDKDQVKYTLHSIYSIGFIKYKLLNDNDKEVPLSTIPELSNLKDIYFFDKDSKPLKKLMCVYKENKENAASDYEGCISLFQSIDEIYSNIVDYIRKTKVVTYVPENMLRFNVDTGKRVKSINRYDISDIILYDKNITKELSKLERDIPNINTQGLTEAFKEAKKNVFAIAGLSASTIDGDEKVGANTSAAAIAGREKLSFRTRSRKIHSWDRALRSLANLMLIYSTSATSVDASNFVIVNNTYDDLDYTVIFPEFTAPDLSSEILTLANAINNNLIDSETAREMLWKDEKTKEELDQITERIKKERASNIKISKKINNNEPFANSKEVESINNKNKEVE